MTAVETGGEYVRCNLCEADDTIKLFSLRVPEHHAGRFIRDEWDVVRCRQCGLVYVNPRPDARAMEVFYSFESAEDHRFVQNWFVESADLQRPTWRQVMRAVSRYRTSGRLLDVGCGAGSFLVEARRLGYEVMGQDIAPFMVEYCRSQQGLTIYADDLDSLPESSSFDCVTAFDMIEHHPDPKRLLRKIHELLKPGGLVVVGTHDIGNWFARLYGPRWRHMHFFHLTYFTRRTLAEMLRACGFRIVHSGGLHTVDRSGWAELRNRVVQFFRLIVLRALILGLYKPVASRAPALTRWRLNWRGASLDHDKLLLRAGNQIIMDDDMLLLAVKD